MRFPILLVFLIGFGLVYDAEAFPAKHEPADNSIYGAEHCIKMTPDNEEKISAIAMKISKFLYNLHIEYEDFDIRLLKIVVEAHSEDEVDEKDTQVQLVVNDCAHTEEFKDAEELREILEEEDPKQKQTIRIGFDNQEEAQDDPKSNDENNSTPKNSTEDLSTKDDNQDAAEATTDEESTVNDTETNNDSETAISSTKATEIEMDKIQPSSTANYDVKGPVLVRLDLDKNGNKLIQGTQMKRGDNVPLLLYVQKVLGNVEYLFGN